MVHERDGKRSFQDLNDIPDDTWEKMRQDRAEAEERRGKESEVFLRGGVKTTITKSERDVAIWNTLMSVNDEVVLVDDYGKLHQDFLTSKAYVLPSGTAIVKTKHRGPYKLSRIWPPGLLLLATGDKAPDSGLEIKKV